LERDSGQTLACGTDTCAILVATRLTGVIPGCEATLCLSGGDFHVAWPRDDAQVIMTGPAVTVRSG